METVYDQLETVDDQLEQLELKTDDIKTLKDELETVGDQSRAVDKQLGAVDKQLEQFKQKIGESKDDLNSQKSLLEGNSVKLYNTLIQVGEQSEKLEAISSTVKEIENQLKHFETQLELVRKRQKANKEANKDPFDGNRLWMLVATLLVFVMPLGFTVFEAGRKGRPAPWGSIKKLLSWIVIILAYSISGFGLMYGESLSGWVGSSLMLSELSESAFVVDESKIFVTGPVTGFFLYQMALTLASGWIVLTALPGRLPIIVYALIALCFCTVIYPVFGHWVAGGRLLPNNPGWLESMGFRDFAGSTWLHSLAAWFTLVWAMLSKEIRGQIGTHSNRRIYSVLGVFILWLGWIGINAGSQFKFDEQIAFLVLNTTLAGAAGGLIAFSSGFLMRDKDRVVRITVNSILGGFVAIAAACDQAVPMEAIAIGGIAGIIYPLGYWLLNNILLKGNNQGRAASIIAVHGFCGVWGTLCVALFGTAGLFAQWDRKQLIIQLEGVLAAFVFATFTAFVLQFVCRAFTRAPDKAVVQG